MAFYIKREGYSSNLLSDCYFTQTGGELMPPEWGGELVKSYSSESEANAAISSLGLTNVKVVEE
tara:strand:- start:225 stop:416 length:192 start_codon:yes stop_codon:yes gene_type:complete